MEMSGLVLRLTVVLPQSIVVQLVDEEFYSLIENNDQFHFHFPVKVSNFAFLGAEVIRIL